MIDYYSANSTIMWIALIVLCVLVYENDRLKRSVKGRYSLTYALIFLAAMFEWIGIHLSGIHVSPMVVHIVKCGDYILTPIAGASFVGQMRIRTWWIKFMNTIISLNVVFQIICIFTDWMIIVDANNDYKHGKLYPVYITVYLVVTAVVVIQFLIYGKKFRKQNRFSLYLIMILILAGIFVQEIFGGEVRTAYVALTMGAMLMYIHSNEFSQQKIDDHILEQQIQIKTDALTGLYSRRAYSQALEIYEHKMPQDFVAISVDINGLKTTNDTLGHEAGDELISGAANCVEQVFGEDGSCYRTGGDEFIVFARMTPDRLKDALNELGEVTSRWKGNIVKSLSLSVGYAVYADHTDATCEELVRVSDKRMYEAKEKYYEANGLVRRIT